MIRRVILALVLAALALFVAAQPALACDPSHRSSSVTHWC